MKRETGKREHPKISSSIEYKEGLTWRSFLAILYSSIVFLPAAIWVSLTSGAGLGSAVQYTTILLFAEIARFFGRKLTKQEVFIMWSSVGAAGTEAVAVALIFHLYYRNAPTSHMFKDPLTGLPLSQVIPTWYAPPLASQVGILRTLWHPDWIMPALVTLGSWILAYRINDIAMGFILYRLYSTVEKLPFPMQRVSAEMVTTISEREPHKFRVLIISAVISMAYGFVLYGVPFITQMRLVPIPMPWVDLTRYLEVLLPGSAFGIATDLLTFASGFVLPFNVVVSMLIGSVAVFLVGNPLAVLMYPTAERPGLFGYTTGMGLRSIYQWSYLYLWASPMIGLAMAAGLAPIIRKPRNIINAFTSLRRLKETEKKKGILQLPIIVALYLGSTLGTIVLVHWLVPDFPLWALFILCFVWPFIMAIISGRAIALAGVGVDVPYFRNAIIMISGYKGIDIWYAPLDTSPGTWVLTSFKIAELTETKITSWIKAYYLATLLAWPLSFLYVQIFWQIAPIPSSAYPYTAIYWPIQVMQHQIWVTRQMDIFRIEHILWAFIIGLGCFLGTSFTKIPFSPIGFVTGFGMPIPTPFTQFIGALAGKIISKKVGSYWWNQNKFAIVAGIGLGMGLITAITAAIGVIGKSMWVLPY